jgi:aspartate carbamoyltransferase catalytic subunit
MKLKNIISTQQCLDKNFLDKLFALTAKMEKDDKAGKLKKTLSGKILACVFYEPSTRTRFSFESAMHKLGGQVITTESASHFSSVTKGETLQDSVKIISGYADAIVLRHNVEGSAKIAADASAIPVINAGDGIGDHPTQGLLDVYTIKKELGKLENLKVGFIGDLLYGRTVHSLMYFLALYRGVKFYCISPKQLKLPKKYTDYLKKNNVKFEELEKLESVVKEMDILYVTRIQQERFKTKKEYEKYKGCYVIDKKILAKLKKDARIMHPLPRVNEISIEVDSDPRAAYFRQAKNGLYIRMALLQMIFKN